MSTKSIKKPPRLSNEEFNKRMVPASPDQLLGARHEKVHKEMTDKPKVFSGEASKEFWAAVWGYWDMMKGKQPMNEQTRFDILYKHGCLAQELEEEELDKLKETKGGTHGL